MVKKEGTKYNEIEAKNNMVLNKEAGEDMVEKKPMKSIVSAAPKKAKKNLIGRLVGGVLGPDGAAGIGEYVVEEIVKPAVKNLIVDSVTSGINKLMYGERGGGYQRPYGTNRPYGGGYQRTNYSSRYTQHNPEPVNRPENRATRGGYRVEEYIIDSRQDAANVLVTLTENADMYNTVSVADYYDCIGVASVYTDNDYGWTIDSITRATIIPVRTGYVIKFPPVEVI